MMWIKMPQMKGFLPSQGEISSTVNPWRSVVMRTSTRLGPQKNSSTTMIRRS